MLPFLEADGHLGVNEISIVGGAAGFGVVAGEEVAVAALEGEVFGGFPSGGEVDFGTDEAVGFLAKSGGGLWLPRWRDTSHQRFHPARRGDSPPGG